MQAEWYQSVPKNSSENHPVSVQSRHGFRGSNRTTRVMKNGTATDSRQFGPSLATSSRTQPAPAGTQHQVVGLFAGIGGLERGLHRAGHRTTLVCDNEPAAREVLRKRFPDIKYHDDVVTLKKLPRATSLVVAGFPCQDL